MKSLTRLLSSKFFWKIEKPSSSPLLLLHTQCTLRKWLERNEFLEWKKLMERNENAKLKKLPLREKCPSTELFLVRIFLYSGRIQENTNQKWLHIRTLFTQCTLNQNRLITMINSRMKYHFCICYSSELEGVVPCEKNVDHKKCIQQISKIKKISCHSTLK